MNECEATIDFGDNYGDNVSTFTCQLEKGHVGLHSESGDMYDQNKYSVAWTYDDRVINLTIDIEYWEKVLQCNHIWQCLEVLYKESNPEVDCRNHEWDYCDECGGMRDNLLSVPKMLEEAKIKLNEINSRGD